MNLRKIALVVVLVGAQASGVNAGPLRERLANLLKVVSLGLLDFTDPNALTGGVFCTNLVRVLKATLSTQLPEEFQDIAEDAACACDVKLGRVEFGCNLGEEICYPEDDVEDQICGDALYRGVYNLGDEAYLSSKACVVLTGSDAKLCVEADHKAGLEEITKLETCKVYAIVNEGEDDEKTIKCQSCTACPTDEFAVKLDCTNVDLTEFGFEGEIPLIDTCVSSGLIAASDILKGDANYEYKPFLSPIN